MYFNWIIPKLPLILFGWEEKKVRTRLLSYREAFVKYIF
jgi:hypothetical protein